MGKSAAAMVEAYPMLIKVTDEISVTNQLTEACMLHLSSEFFYTELEALAYLNHTNFSFSSLCLETFAGRATKNST